MEVVFFHLNFLFEKIMNSLNEVDPNDIKGTEHIAFKLREHTTIGSKNDATGLENHKNTQSKIEEKLETKKQKNPKNEKSSQIVTNWPRYLIWALTYINADLYKSLTLAFTISFYASLKNHEVKFSKKLIFKFEWDDDEGSLYLSLLIGPIYAGQLVSAIIHYIFKNRSPHCSILFAKIFFAISCFMMISGNIYVMIAARSIQGIVIGVLINNAPPGLY